MCDSQTPRDKRSVSKETDRQDCLWIKRRRYTILEELGVRHRPRLLVFDCGSRCRRLIMRLPNDAATFQHLRVLRRLPRRNAVPQVIDSQVQKDECLVVLDWTEGVDLDSYLRQVKNETTVAPSAYESVRIIRGLVHGLLQLHQYAQLIHGDLKPANLILTRKPAFLAMIDYGSAWQVERSAFREQGDGVSPVYAAPEQQGKEAWGDGRSDQFSVSVILYQLLTGVIPYNGLGGQAGLKRYRSHFQNEPSPPSEAFHQKNGLPRSLVNELERVVLRGLRLDAESRYPTTSAWLDDVEGVFVKLKAKQTKNNSGGWHRFVDRLATLVFSPFDSDKPQNDCQTQ